MYCLLFTYSVHELLRPVRTDRNVVFASFNIRANRCAIKGKNIVCGTLSGFLRYFNSRASYDSYVKHITI